MTVYRCSASQISTAELCLRKWGFDKIDHVPRSSSPSAALGTAVHAQIETYLRDGTPLDLSRSSGQIAMAGAHLWPKAPLVTEHRFDVTLGEVPFVGFIDVLTPTEIIDHKTTKDLRWAKTPDELQADPQATLYAHVTGVPRGRWIYYRTTPAYKAIDISVSLDTLTIRPRIEQTIETARKLRVLAGTMPEGSAIELPPTYSACDAFGGCPHRAACSNRSDQESFRSMLDQAAALDALKNRVNPPAASAPAPSAAAPTDGPPPLANGQALPAGFFWLRGQDGQWGICPESKRATEDPDGSRAWPPPVVPAPTIEAPTAPAPELAATIAAVLPTEAPADPLAAALASRPARKPRTPRAKPVDDGPDLDPRVKVLHDPEATPADTTPLDEARADNLNDLLVGLFSVKEVRALFREGLITKAEARRALGVEE